jgi:hypothetical protein
MRRSLANLLSLSRKPSDALARDGAAIVRGFLDHDAASELKGLVEELFSAIAQCISLSNDTMAYHYRARQAIWLGELPAFLAINTPTAGEHARLGPLPGFVSGGPQNPMGARGLYLYSDGKDTQYRIHGTNQPEYIGQAISSGCIRMTNEDVIDLYNRVKVGTIVVVLPPSRWSFEILPPNRSGA